MPGRGYGHGTHAKRATRISSHFALLLTLRLLWQGLGLGLELQGRLDLPRPLLAFCSGLPLELLLLGQTPPHRLAWRVFLMLGMWRVGCLLRLILLLWRRLLSMLSLLL